MGTISGCRHLKVNLKAEIYIYVNFTTHRCPSKIIKLFLPEVFSHLPPVSLTPVVYLEPRISPRILKLFIVIFSIGSSLCTHIQWSTITGKINII
jgi:hypothetical protein